MNKSIVKVKCEHSQNGFIALDREGSVLVSAKQAAIFWTFFLQLLIKIFYLNFKRELFSAGAMFFWSLNAISSFKAAKKGPRRRTPYFQKSYFVGQNWILVQTPYLWHFQPTMKRILCCITIAYLCIFIWITLGHTLYQRNIAYEYLRYYVELYKSLVILSRYTIISNQI